MKTVYKHYELWDNNEQKVIRSPLLSEDEFIEYLNNHPELVLEEPKQGDFAMPAFSSSGGKTAFHQTGHLRDLLQQISSFYPNNNIKIGNRQTY